MDNAFQAPMMEVPHMPPRVAVPNVHVGRVAVPHVSAPVKPPVGAIGAAELGIKQAKPETAAELKIQGQEKTADRIQSVGSKLLLPFNLWMFSDLGKIVRISKWPGINKMERLKTGAASVFISVPEAFKNTTISDVFSLGANHQKSMAEIATNNGGKAAVWGEKAAARAETMAVKAATRNAWMGEKLAPVGKVISNSLDRFGATSMGSKLAEWIGRGSLGTAAKSLGKTNLFVTTAVVGTAVVVGSHFVRHSATKKRNAMEQQEIEAAGGGADNAYVQNLKEEMKSQKRIDFAKMAFDVGNDVGLGSMAVIPGAGSAALGVAQMVPFMGQMLIQDNDVAKAYRALKDHESGKAPLSDADQLTHMRHLVSKIADLKDPKLHGIANRQVTPTAKALLAKYDTVDARIAVMADHAKFDAFLKENVPSHPAAANDAHGHANAHMDIKPQTHAEAAYMASEKPGSTVIHGAGAEHGTEAHGRVVGTQRHLA